jgi:SnoaL-like polyketide cyclase
LSSFLRARTKAWGYSDNREHAVAENDWVMGRSKSTVTHSKTVLGLPPKVMLVETTFWNLHRFDANRLIIETWNLMDSLAIMQRLGLMGGKKAEMTARICMNYAFFSRVFMTVDCVNVLMSSFA